jgi:hypothetical protein
MLENKKEEFFVQLSEKDNSIIKTESKSEKSTKKRSSSKDSPKKSNKKLRKTKCDICTQTQIAKYLNSIKITKFALNFPSNFIHYSKLDYKEAKKSTYSLIQKIPKEIHLGYSEFKYHLYNKIILDQNKTHSFDYLFKDISLIKGEYLIENNSPKLSLLCDYNGKDPFTYFGNMYGIISNSLAILDEVNYVYQLVSNIVYENHHFLVIYQIYIEKNKLTNSFILKRNIQIKYNRFKQIRNRPCNTYSKIKYINRGVSELIEEDEIKWKNIYDEENQFNAEYNDFYDSF